MYMEALREDIRSVSGVYFCVNGETNNLMNKSEKISYMVYLRNKPTTDELGAMRKFIRMFAIPYRVVLIDDNNKEGIGFLLFGDCEEKEQLDSIMEWIALKHPEWDVVNCLDGAYVPKIIGYRIANNPFHAKRLILQGEILEI